MRSTLLLTGLTTLLLAAPAAAQVPPVQIGEAAAAAVTPVRTDEGVRVGRLLVERTGDRIVATTTFRGRPPAGRVTLCVTVERDERCVRRRPGRHGQVRLERSGAFTASLEAVTAWRDARGAIEM